MIRRPSRILAAIGIVSFLLAQEAAARPATVSDFAICNQEATEASGGSAMPSPGTPTPRPAPPGTPARPDTAASGGMASGTDSTGKIVAGARDPRDEGMSADYAGNAAYRTAYRECMARRGITAKPAS